MSETSIRRESGGVSWALPADLAAWLSERTPEIGLSHPQRPREMVFQLAMVLDYRSENQTSVSEPLKARARVRAAFWEVEEEKRSIGTLLS